jgi:hypothetical protein
VPSWLGRYAASTDSAQSHGTTPYTDTPLVVEYIYTYSRKRRQATYVPLLLLLLVLYSSRAGLYSMGQN